MTEAIFPFDPFTLDWRTAQIQREYGGGASGMLLVGAELPASLWSSTSWFLSETQDASEGLPDDTACASEDWDAKVDALIADVRAFHATLEDV